MIVFVAEAEAFAADLEWQSVWRQPLARWGDEGSRYGLPVYFRGVVYDDWLKIDWSIWPEELLQRIAEEPLHDQLDVGYRVLLDKTGVTARWAEPTYRAHIPAPPTQVEPPCHPGVTTVPSRLGGVNIEPRRLPWTLASTSSRASDEMSVISSSRKPGAYGRGLERLLDPETAEELAATYVGSGIEENWEALFATTALFRRVATDVADALDLRYPEELDDIATGYLEAVRDLNR